MTRESGKRKQGPKQEYDNSLRLMLAYLCVATEAESSLVRKVEILDKFDLSDAEIARVCGRSTGSVRNARLTVKRHHAT